MILTVKELEARLETAESRVNEAIENDDTLSAQYWTGRRDAVKDVLENYGRL